MPYILRHGETLANKNGKFRGWENFPLDETGHAQAEQAAHRLIGHGIRKIVTSPLDRSKATGKVIAQQLGIPSITVDVRLMPLNVGKFSGKEREANMPEFRTYQENRSKKIPSGESIAEFEARQAQPFADYRDAAGLLLVMHTSNITAFHNLGSGAQDIPEGEDVVQPGDIVLMDRDGDMRLISPGHKPKNALIEKLAGAH